MCFDPTALGLDPRDREPIGAEPDDRVGGRWTGQGEQVEARFPHCLRANVVKVGFEPGNAGMMYRVRNSTRHIQHGEMAMSDHQDQRDPRHRRARLTGDRATHTTRRARDHLVVHLASSWAATRRLGSSR